MNEKWYLETYFICIMFALWFFIVPFIVGLILLSMQNKEKQRWLGMYGHINDLNARSERLNIEINAKRLQLQSQLQAEQVKINNARSEYQRILNETELVSLVNQYKYSDYDGLSSEECKNKLALLKAEEQEALKSGRYIQSKIRDRRTHANNAKQIVRCFNCEADNILLGLSTKNIDQSRQKITRSFESLNKIFEVDGIQITAEYLKIKLEELNLVHTFELKREQEKEIQKAIKEQMIEEEKVRKEIERQKAKIEKDATQFTNEITKLMGYAQKTQSEVEKQLYVDKIRDLEEKLKQLEKDKETVLEREANARAGFVYIISNIGSFGNDVYKIGMTRRLEPMDRVRELGSASVPFDFDVHAMIFAEDAPALESALHQAFAKQSVNRVNPRKEFFRVSLEDIEKVVVEKYNNTVSFTRIPVATEYNTTLEIIQAEAV